MESLGLTFDLPVGFTLRGEYVKKISLLESNSIAEEVFTTKMAQQPFTWITRVISVAVGSIGDVSVGQQVRDDYFKTKQVNVPRAVLDIPWADANTLLLEIHRRVWESNIPKQETMCRFCTKAISVDIDLNKIELPEESQDLIDEVGEFSGISVKLSPFKLSSLLSKAKDEEVAFIKDSDFNNIVFRVPTIGDAVKNESYFDQNIELWRRVGADCLEAIQKIDDEGNVEYELPKKFVRLIGIKLFGVLLARNLKVIRHELRESLPVMPFAYMDDCACDSKRKIPFVLDSSGFFSE